jgi:hypothetical protein
MRVMVASSISSQLNARLAPMARRLENFFHTREVDRDPRLKIICGCLLLYYLLTFFYWWPIASSVSTAGNKVLDYAPAAIIQNFRWLIFMNSVLTRDYMYVLGMLALFGLFSLFYFRSSLPAMITLGFLFVNKLYYYLGDSRWFDNYHHFHLLFSLVFLLARDKLRFFRVALAVGYVMSAMVKITPSWLYGEYFNSVPDHLPFLPNISWVITAASLLVFLMELLGPLAWFTNIRWLRLLSFGMFILFHVYSGFIVGLWYTSLMVPLAITAFIRFDRPLQAGYHFARRDLAPLAILALLIAGGLYHYLLPGDVRLTCEGRYYGFFMFDANRQTTFTMEIQKGDKDWKLHVFRAYQQSGGESAVDVSGRVGSEIWLEDSSGKKIPVTRPMMADGQVVFNPVYFLKIDNRKSGDPYYYYYYARQLQDHYHPDRLSLHLEVQLNGHPESVTLLDIPDFGKLNPTYNPFKHNDWILLPGTNSPPEYRWP